MDKQRGRRLAVPRWEQRGGSQIGMMNRDSEDTSLLRAAWRHGQQGTESPCGHDGTVP